MAATQRLGSNIQITGVKQTIAALQAFDPEIKKTLTKQIREALATTRTRAIGKYPRGAWSINVNQKKILGSIVARSGARAVRWGDSDPGVRAAIFEFAGSTQPGKTPQARAMIASLNARYGQPGRFLWSAWDETGAGVLNDIQTAVRGAERELQARLDAIGEGY